MEEELIVIELEEEQEIVVVENDIEYIAPTTQEKIIIPKKEQQFVVPDEGVFALSKVTVEAIPNEYIKPNGTLDITVNGEYDVKQYEKANVSVGGVSINNARYLFYNNNRIDQIEEVLSLVSSNVIDYGFLFQYCSNLTTIPLIDISNGKILGNMFDGCSSLVSIPQLDTRNSTDWYQMFRTCRQLTTVPQLDASNCNRLQGLFFQCSNLTTLGGFKDLGKSYSTTSSTSTTLYKLDLSVSTLLTHESLMNVINNLYDIASIGVKPQDLVLGATNLAKLTEEEIAIAQTKGWNVS